VKAKDSCTGSSRGRGSRRTIRGIRIIHEDDDVIVVEKAAGVLSQATRCGASARMHEHTVEGALGDWVRKGQSKSRKRVYLVHRLDRDTSGVMMVAKSEEVQDYFRSNWNELTEKTYLARVEGRMDAPSGVFESYLCEDPKTLNVHSVSDPSRGKLSRTEWEVVDAGRNTSLVKVSLKSGRRNQIRVHFAEAGHPVCGDVRYGREGRGLCLHAWKLTFVHPRTHETCTFEAPPPIWARLPRAENETGAKEGRT